MLQTFRTQFGEQLVDEDEQLFGCGLRARLGHQNLEEHVRRSMRHQGARPLTRVCKYKNLCNPSLKVKRHITLSVYVYYR